MGITARPVAGKTLLSRDDHMLVLIDFQSQMAFATKSIDTTLLRNKAALVSRAAASFNVPAVLPRLLRRASPDRCSPKSATRSEGSRSFP